MSTGIVTAGDVRGFFQTRMSDVLDRQGVRLETHTEFYLVNLLADYAGTATLYERQEDGTHEEVTLALLLKRALEQPPTQRVATFRKMGDTSLFVSGFFSDRLQRRLVDVDYYIEMGGRAYGSAAELVGPTGGNETFTEIFAELAEKFARLVDCLMEISEDTLTTCNDGVVRLYERWLSTGSERLARKLHEGGILLAKPGTGWVH